MKLEFKNVCVTYGGAIAVEDVSMTVNDGELVSLLGSNGAGKTTLLRAVSGLKAISAGEIWCGEQRIDTMSPPDRVKLGIGHVPDGRQLFPYMTVRENLYLGAFLRKDRAAVNHDLGELLERFAVLGERMNQQARSLSGGEQQMLAICRAMMGNPRLLLLDEPSLGLAPKMVMEIGKMVLEISERSVSVLFVEQNASLAFTVCQRAYVMERGRIVMEGLSSDLMNDERLRTAYLGEVG